MQIEIKSQGLGAFVRELAQNADVTSTVVAAGVAVILSYGLWKIGRGIARANRAIKTKLESTAKPRTESMVFAATEPVAVDTTSALARHWRRIETHAAGNIALAGAARATHERAGTLIDALTFEISSLLAEVASVSAYAAGRTGRVPQPVRLPVKTAPQRHSMAA